MSNGKFTAVVDDFVRVSKERETALFQEATKRTIDIANQSVFKGGRMRVDTGFLRASGQASLNGMPSGPTRGDPEAGPLYYDDGLEVPAETVLTIAKARIGDTIFFGWTANYARAREAKDAFMRIAVQNWPQTVATVLSELKKRIRGRG